MTELRAGNGTPRPEGSVRTDDYARAILNILEDAGEERARLGATQKAVLNILADASEERTRLESTQRAVLNILDDTDEEQARVAATQRAILNILDDAAEERSRLEATQRAALNILEDIDVEKKRVEQANADQQREIGERRKAEERVQLVFELAPNAMLVADRQGRMMQVNSQLLVWFGYAREDLIGQPVELLIPERFRAGHPALRTGYMGAPRLRPMGTSRELYARRKNGSEFPVEISLSPLEGPDGVHVIAGIADVSERKRNEEALIHAKTVAEASSKELEAFSYSVAHDLRAPLRSINGFSQALLEDYGGRFDAEGQKYLNHVRDAATQMGQLIDALLNLSRVTRTELYRETVDLSGLARTVLARLTEAQPERQAECSVADGIVAQADTRLMDVVLTNLLGNAWKFTGKRPGARIEFGARSEDPPVYFVRDNGAGFDAQYAGKLFGVFQRLHSVREYEGTGIGLATVQRIIHRHGGRVWAEGQVDRGATFYFTLAEPRP